MVSRKHVRTFGIPCIVVAVEGCTLLVGAPLPASTGAASELKE
jgi:hypothetical protein